MVLRIEEAGMSSYVGPAAAAGAEVGVEGWNFSMSFFVMRPPGPVPLTCLMGTPFSSARTFAEGEAAGSRSRLVCRRPPVDSDSCGSGVGSEGGGAVLEPVSGGSDDSVASSLGASFGGAFSPPASSSVNDSNGDMSSPSSTSTAIGC